MRWALVGICGATYLAGAAIALLWPHGASVRRILLDAYVFGLYRLGLPIWVTPEWYEAAGNVVLFVPLGAGLGLALRRWWWVGALIGIGLSLAVEAAQAMPGMERVPQWTDVVWNGMGAMIGAAIGWRLARRPSPGLRDP